MDKDTICLLKECNAGCKMGLKSLEDLVEKAHNQKMANQIKHAIDKRSVVFKYYFPLMETYEMAGYPERRAKRIRINSS